jgi:hypothetical protein
MAFHYSPKIVTDGLVLYLDAANTKSFQIGSTTWNDLSKNKLSGSLLNGATFSSLNGGGIFFDGIDDILGISDENILSYSGSGTIDFVYSINSIPASDFRNVWGFSNSLFQYENNAGFMLFVWKYDDLTFSGSSTGISHTDLNTYHITCTYTTSIGSSTFKVYKNGLLMDTKVVSKTLISSSKSPFILAGNSQQNCSIYNLKIYNRELSTTEILKNFNATKTRFGL